MLLISRDLRSLVEPLLIFMLHTYLNLALSFDYGANNTKEALKRP